MIFKVGDRVKSLGGLLNPPIGELGTVVNINESAWAYPIEVAFDLDGDDAANDPWPMDADEIEAATE